MCWKIIQEPLQLQRLQPLTLKGISLFKHLIRDLRMD